MEARMTTDTPRIGLTLSGGGFRATAFGLGALRALNAAGVLNNVQVVSGISGGSLLTAMWAYGPADFEQFDESVVELLTQGLQVELARRAFAPALASRNVLSAVGARLPGRLRLPRTSTRTEALVAALKAREFGSKAMTDVTHPGLMTIISATDLSTANAVRFGSHASSCSPHGVIAEPVPVADAVAASAAFPLLLPQLSRTYTFTRSDGTRHVETLALTDGGVYDNLGVTPLLPGRSLDFTSHVYELDCLVVIDAGPGRMAPKAPNFMAGRLKRSFEIAHIRSQDGSRARIHQVAAAGQIDGLVHAYLGTKDANLPMDIPGLIPREKVMSYPTNFAKMSPEELHAVTQRGQQLTAALVEHYCPQLSQ